MSVAASESHAANPSENPAMTAVRRKLAPAFTTGEAPDQLRERAWSVAARVPDPAISSLTVVDLGVLRDIKIADGTLEVFVTAPDIGSPAMRVIALNIEEALEAAGFGLARITPLRSPAWAPDWMSAKARATLERVAAPAAVARRRTLLGR
jgi:ring-1,2-phenylacetyl-CoA epoxidase subunit PaaD